MALGRSREKPVFLHEKFRAFREKHFKTQQKLADLLDCTTQLISLWEMGDARPPKWRLKVLAQTFPGLDPQREFFRNGQPR